MTAPTQRTVLITGASSGIGAATARTLASQGNAVVLCARRQDRLDALADEISSNGGRAVAVACDVSDFGQVASGVDAAGEAFGCIDVLVNNAGLIEPISHLAKSDPSAWRRVVDVNLTGAYHAIRACLPGMLEAGGGTIINLSSGAATNPLEAWSHYCATKAALLALTRCTDLEYRDQGIRCIGISPGTVATDMQTSIRASGINPVSQRAPASHIPPDWVAQAIAWLCTPEADPWLGKDFSIKTDEGRALVGLPAIGD